MRLLTREKCFNDAAAASVRQRHRTGVNRGDVTRKGRRELGRGPLPVGGPVEVERIARAPRSVDVDDGQRGQLVRVDGIGEVDLVVDEALAQ